MGKMDGSVMMVAIFTYIRLEYGIEYQSASLPKRFNFFLLKKEPAQIWQYLYHMSDTVIKFTELEMQDIAKLQAEYQQKIFELGQLELAKVELEQQQSDLVNTRNKLFEEWKRIQAQENSLLKQLSDKYGDGTLSLKDGTFKPNAQ